MSFPMCYILTIFLLQKVFYMMFFNGAKQEWCLFPQQNEFKAINCWICHVCVTFLPLSACVLLFSVCFFVVVCFSPFFLLCFFSVLSAGMRETICVCMLHMCYIGFFKQPRCRSNVTNKGCNTVLGSLMLLTSFSRTTRPHHADRSVSNHSILVQIVPFLFLFPNSPFCWNPFQATPFCSQPIQSVPFCSVPSHSIPFCFKSFQITFCTQHSNPLDAISFCSSLLDRHLDIMSYLDFIQTFHWVPFLFRPLCSSSIPIPGVLFHPSPFSHPGCISFLLIPT